MQSNFFSLSICMRPTKKYSRSERKISGIVVQKIATRMEKKWEWFGKKKLYIVQRYHLTPNIFSSGFVVVALLIKRCVLSSIVMTTLDRAMVENIANMHIPYTTNTTSESHKNRPRIELCIYNFHSIFLSGR